jgi:hypothetical protein
MEEWIIRVKSFNYILVQEEIKIISHKVYSTLKSKLNNKRYKMYTYL